MTVVKVKLEISHGYHKKNAFVGQNGVKKMHFSRGTLKLFIIFFIYGIIRGSMFCILDLADLLMYVIYQRGQKFLCKFYPKNC